MRASDLPKRSKEAGIRSTRARLAGRAAAAALALACAFLAPVAARASGGNPLTRAGSIGVIRVYPVAQTRNGNTIPLTGDPHVPAANPQRTVGDSSATGPSAACTANPPPSDCYRSLAFNDVSFNDSAGDGHTHYHPGDSTLLVNEVKDFQVGDTVLIGSPYCDVERLNSICKRYFPGLGTDDEQPDGELAVIVGGDAGKGLHGPGLIRLAAGLRNLHPEGTRIVKLPTVAAGQQLMVSIPNAEILGGTTNQVTVHADLILPQGSHRTDASRIHLATDHDHPTQTSVVVTASTSSTTFYIPAMYTGTRTIGPGFSVDTADTWYTVAVQARNDAGETVSSGALRFKLANPFFAAFARDTSGNVKQNGSIRIFGVLDENTPSAANRSTDDVAIQVDVRRPDGTVKTIYTHSCYDNDPSSKDSCGGDTFGSQKEHHGQFMVGYGGGKAPLFYYTPPYVGAPPSPLNRLFGSKPCRAPPPYSECLKGSSNNDDTAQKGTYTVVGTVQGSDIAASFTFTVA